MVRGGCQEESVQGFRDPSREHSSLILDGLLGTETYRSGVFSQCFAPDDKCEIEIIGATLFPEQRPSFSI